VIFEAGPFGVGEVGLIGFSHARYLTEPPPQNPFSDGFLQQFAMLLSHIITARCLLQDLRKLLCAHGARRSISLQPPLSL
jgi:hypothetical protein